MFPAAYFFIAAVKIDNLIAKTRLDLCSFIGRNKQTNRQTDRQTDKQTHTQTNKQIKKQTHKQTNTQTNTQTHKQAERTSKQASKQTQNMQTPTTMATITRILNNKRQTSKEAHNIFIRQFLVCWFVVTVVNVIVIVVIVIVVIAIVVTGVVCWFVGGFLINSWS